MRNRPFRRACGVIADARNGRGCRTSGQWGAAAFSVSAASAYPYAAIEIDQELARLYEGYAARAA